ncbi:hypothetical protein PI124_g9474 [Phytophthora idaei]|nr:hypothetical protein PI125_g8704 [Phytophthora idaei]KAG3157037.1 hypothetical protein PI126_g8492 [Phytophthora idaei]KAG3245795.1 hypothetical protein PI124_g9474 [Phytophthora idaei]
MARSKGHIPNGVRFKNISGLDFRGFCEHHERQGLPRCQGFKVGTKIPCNNHAKKNYDYCSATHDPSIPHIPPSVLDPTEFYLRGRVQGDVVAQWKDQDIYNWERLDLATPYALGLDHILEKQCFTYALSQLNLRKEDDDFALATGVLRESVVNEPNNLALTLPSTNRVKGTGVYKFLDDARTGHRDKTFTGYLGEFLKRDVTRRITRNMGISMKKCQRKLSDEGDTPVLEKLSGQLQKLNRSRNSRPL